MNLRAKNVTVVGLGKSGLAACNLLLEKGAKVSITECRDSPQIREQLRSLNSKDIVEIEIGRHTESLITGRDLIVTSPGVPLHASPLIWAKEKNIPVIGEMELAFRFCPAPVIAITGTNGKTTVTTLVGEIFKAAGKKCVVCGNIGAPFSAELKDIRPEHTVVLEVSSFQLETIERFKPKVAAVLNLSADHLDRYADFDEYYRVKCRIFSRQDQNDWAVLNEDPYGHTLQAKTKAKVLFFSKNSDKSDKQLNNNHYAALAIASIFGVPQDLAKNSCRQFKGLKHRIEEIACIRGIRFINDSKATNIDSTLWALNSIEGPIVLIAGGRDKGSDFSGLSKKFGDKVRAMVLLGEAKEKIGQAFKGKLLSKRAATLPQAVKLAWRLTRTGDCVLLSPMCASFDMFSNYAERGEVFKKAVQSLV